MKSNTDLERRRIEDAPRADLQGEPGMMFRSRLKKGKALSVRFLSVCSLLLGLILNACGLSNHSNNPDFYREDTASFSADMISAIGMDTLSTDPKTLKPSTKNYTVKVCLRDSQSGQPITSQIFDIEAEPPGYSKNPTDFQGCLYWSEVVSFDWLNHHPVEITRHLKGRGNYQGNVTVSFKIEPWRTDLMALRDSRMPTLEAASDVAETANASSLLIVSPSLAINLGRTFGVDRDLNQSIRRNFQITLPLSAVVKNANNDGDVPTPVQGGHFRVRGFIYSVDGANETTLKNEAHYLMPTLYSAFELKSQAQNGILQSNDLQFNFDFPEQMYFASYCRIVLLVSSLDAAKSYESRWVAARFNLLMDPRPQTLEFGPESLIPEDQKQIKAFESREIPSDKRIDTKSPFEQFMDYSSYTLARPADFYGTSQNPVSADYALVPADQNELILRSESDRSTLALKRLCFQFNGGEDAHSCRRNPREWIQINSLTFVENLLGQPAFTTAPTQISLQAYLKNETEISNHHLDGARDMREVFASVGVLAFFQGIIPLEGAGLRFAHDDFHVEQLEHASLTKAGHVDTYQRTLNVEITEMTVKAKVRRCVSIVPIKGQSSGKHLLLCSYLAGAPAFEDDLIQESWYFISDADSGDHSAVRDSSQLSDRNAQLLNSDATTTQRNWSMTVRGRVPFEAIESMILVHSREALRQHASDIRAVEDAAIGYPDKSRPAGLRQISPSEVLLREGALPGVIIR